MSELTPQEVREVARSLVGGTVSYTPFFRAQLTIFVAGVEVTDSHVIFDVDEGAENIGLENNLPVENWELQPHMICLRTIDDGKLQLCLPVPDEGGMAFQRIGRGVRGNDNALLGAPSLFVDLNPKSE